MPVTSSSSKPDASASRIVGETTIHKERWLTLTRIDYVDPEGTRRQWDAVRRSTTTSNAEADAVCVFATLRGGDVTCEEGEVVLARQFRPACGGETVELPAGLVDDGESCETAALRELREECGYVGEVTGKTPSVVLSPGLSDERVVMVSVDVDLDEDAAAQEVEDLIGEYSGYANDTLSMFYTSFFVGLLWLFYDETVVAALYGIRVQDFVYYFLFQVAITPFQIVIDIIFLNIVEWYHHYPIHDYLDYMALRFTRRRARWKGNESIVNKQIDEGLQSLDKLCFSSQHYFV